MILHHMAVSHKRWRVVTCGRNRKPRPKTFKSAEAAKKWAEANKISKYDIVQLKVGLSKKFKIVAK